MNPDGIQNSPGTTQLRASANDGATAPRCPGRVVLVVPEFPQASETFVAAKFAGLLERGWDVHVACLDSRRANWQLFPELRANRSLRRRVHVAWPLRPRWLAAALTPFACIRCLLGNPSAFSRWLRQGVGSRQLNRLYVDAEIFCLRPDIVHFEFGALASTRVDLGEILGCRIVVSFRGYDLNVVGLDEPRYYDQVWRHASALHFLGRDLYEKAAQRGWAADTPHMFIPPAVDTGRFRPRSWVDTQVCGAPDRPLRILSVGRLDWRKGYEYAATALGILSARGIACTWRVVGSGPYLECIAFSAHQSGVRDATRFLGHLPPDGVRSEMAQADVFLHPAVSEGFCNAVLEAQASGLPVVCSDAGGLPENVQDGVTGFVTPRRDAVAVADALARLAADPVLRERMGEAASTRVQRSFELGQLIARFEELYGSVGCAVSRRPSAGGDAVSRRAARQP